MAHRCIFKIGKCGLSYAFRRSTVARPSVFLNRENYLAFLQKYKFSSQAETATQNEIKSEEKSNTSGKKTHEFQGDTRMLLQIVAKSLYSNKEVFIRELVSNASDALEKLRYTAVTEGKPLPKTLGIYITTNKQERIFSIKDTGIGMTKNELINNLGTIARSGSKAFIEELQKKGESGIADSSNIIGQFGVGFYSSFMVADKVEVFTKSANPNSTGYKWSSDGTGTYDIEEYPDVTEGTEIRVYLKTESREFSDENVVKGKIKKYSNFIGSPIYVNGAQYNVIQPLWLKDPKDIEPEHHTEFYRFISDSQDTPRFTLQYKTDSPLMIKAVFYFPETKPSIYQFPRESKCGVALYAKKVLIQSQTQNLLPQWLRFLKGVVDSEDIPLNLSRELLQNSALIAKLQSVLTLKIISFLGERLRKDRDAYEKFYSDYGIYLKEGILLSDESYTREKIGKLLLYEFASTPGVKHTLTDYVNNIKEKGDNTIYYLNAPSRELAEASPYYESIKKKNVEVIFCYERYDEIVLSRLQEFQNCKIMSVESDIRESSKDDVKDEGSLKNTGDLDNLETFFKTTLQGKVHSVKSTRNLESHPCLVTVEEMASAREFMRTATTNLGDDIKYSLLRPQLEINLKHPIIQKLSKLTESDPKLAELLAQQLFANAMVQAGLLEDPRTIILKMNELLTLALDKV